jgi:2'-hydroxyisoflavone reductase
MGYNRNGQTTFGANGMKILMIGGTRFVGRHLVEAALARGHELTLFHRGQHGPDLFPQLEKINGDRTIDLAKLANRRWDVVIDTCGYFPRAVRLAAEFLTQQVDRYVFISTISVYAEPAPRNFNEDAPLYKEIDPSIEVINGETYGPLKVACERVVQEVWPNKNLIIRPGYVVGPHDHTDRFTYWPRRVAHGGEMIAPGQPDLPMQFVDARDLAEWSIKMIEAQHTGIYHVTGPREPLSLKELLQECWRTIKIDLSVTWLDEKFLAEAGVDLYSDFPLWSPIADSNFLTADCSQAVEAGLTYRALADTIRDTLAWDATRPIDLKRVAGLSIEREQEILQRWHAK